MEDHMAIDFCFNLGDEVLERLQAYMSKSGFQGGNINLSHPDIIFSTPDKLQEAIALANHGSTCCIVIDRGTSSEHDLDDFRTMVASMFTAGKTVFVELIDLNLPEDAIIAKLTALSKDTAFAQHFLDETLD
jgi:hypothetical protein